MSWVLVLYIYAGMLAKGDSVTMVTVPMSSEVACQAAGNKSASLVDASTKVLKFVCLKNL